MRFRDRDLLDLMPFNFVQAMRRIEDDYEQVVWPRSKDLRKFGGNGLVSGAGASIMTLPGGVTEETFLDTNGITHVVCKDDGDAQNLRFIEGHVRSGSNLTFDYDDTVIALSGNTAVALNTPLNRSSRARLSAPAADDIYFFEGGATTGGVPDDLSTVHMMIQGGEIQTQKAATSTSQWDWLVINSFTSGILEKTGSWAKTRIEIKPIDEDYFYPLCEYLPLTDSGGKKELFEDGSPLLIVPPNHDVRVWGVANTTGVSVDAGFSGYFFRTKANMTR